MGFGTWPKKSLQRQNSGLWGKIGTFWGQVLNLSGTISRYFHESAKKIFEKGNTCVVKTFPISKCIKRSVDTRGTESIKEMHMIHRVCLKRVGNEWLICASSFQQHMKVESEIWDLEAKLWHWYDMTWYSWMKMTKSQLS